ncbi:galactose mutarotase-like [Planococcus citri]|uniref:galactose mutarotase-like n=1 Tax=Planococcus citri TaxID=170843 RepID=UPI0031F7794A
MTTHSAIKITTDSFGEAINHKTNKIEPVCRYTLQSADITLQVISYGATITSIKTKDKNGKLDDIVLGFDDIRGYKSDLNPYFGATVGRYANRIGGGQFKLDGKTYNLIKNMGNNQLHGGLIGFDKVNWKGYIKDNKIIFTYLSSDGEEGFPADLLSTITYELKANTLSILFEAVSNGSTVINLTNHSYFNLAGHGAGSEGVYDHVVAINADKITILNKEMIATGQLKCVGGTNYDLRTPQNLGKAIHSIPETGFDFNYCLNKFQAEKKTPTFAARVIEPKSGRYLELFTDQPGVQFYTGNSIKDGIGKNGAKFGKQSAFCLETQNYPNSVNIESFPSSILRPGEKYEHRAIYVFGVEQTSF